MNITPNEVQNIVELREKLRDTDCISYAKYCKKRIDNILACAEARTISEENNIKNKERAIV